MADFMATGMTKLKVSRLNANLTLGGAAKLGLKDPLMEAWLEAYQKDEAPYTVTAQQFVTMFGSEEASHFVDMATCQFGGVKILPVPWWCWFFGLPEDKAAQVTETRLKALIVHASRELKPLTEAEMQKIYG